VGEILKSVKYRQSYHSEFKGFVP